MMMMMMMMAENEDKEEPYRKRSVSREGRRCDGLHMHVNHARRICVVSERLCARVLPMSYLQLAFIVSFPGLRFGVQGVSMRRREGGR